MVETKSEYRKGNALVHACLHVNVCACLHVRCVCVCACVTAVQNRSGAHSLGAG